MRPLILGEYRRLCRHPLGMTLAVLFVLGSLYCAVGSQSSASASLKNVRNNIETVAQGCETELNSPEQKTRCRKDVPHELKGLRQYEVTFTAYGLRAANGQHPVASVVWTMKLATSVPGLTLVVLVAAFFVAGEWSRGSIVPRLLYEARLSRLLAAKAAAVWLWMLTLVAVSSAVTATVGMLHTRSAFPLPSPGALGEVLAETATVLAAGAAVLAGAAAGAVVLAALVRLPLRTSFVGLLLLLLVVQTAGIPVVGAWLPGGALSDLVGFGGIDSVWDHFWVSTAPSTVPAPLRAVPTLLGIALLWAFLQRRSRTRDLV
ncbi:hypothetical protein OG756_22825 [Streptomyces sp. NBC_01310]|uniref:hypothetical protein n=1 Tax=Streptomyces sp. NBC_01310 TaxID=2903820 RepID=UPI0035B5D404|nr:hypothetical protein OG756_22825 [Streptomyces sp. NBC_01310]